ncbi:MAG: Ig-like domain-containing protein [Solirubrobacteraceae bacterium]
MALTAPAAESTLAGTVTLAATAFDTRGITSVTFRANGQPVATDTAPDGSPFGAPGAAYSADVDTTQLADGSYLVDAVATDASGRTATSAQRRVFVKNTPSGGGGGGDGGGGGGGGGGGDDRPPTVAFTSPADRAIVKGSTTVTVNASDDRGVAKVELFNGSTLICSDTTAPYSCAFSPRGSDVGRQTLFAVATDTAGQTASAARRIIVARFTARSVTARATPARDRSAPYRFVTRGRVSLPSGVTAALGCGSGVVSVQVKVGAKTISNRRVALRKDCTYSSSVTFRSRGRLGRSGRLKVTARFLGNRVLGLKVATSRFVRVG